MMSLQTCTLRLVLKELIGCKVKGVKHILRTADELEVFVDGDTVKLGIFIFAGAAADRATGRKNDRYAQLRQLKDVPIQSPRTRGVLALMPRRPIGHWHRPLRRTTRERSRVEISPMVLPLLIAKLIGKMRPPDAGALVSGLRHLQRPASYTQLGSRLATAAMWFDRRPVRR